ncbi:MAG: circularly permuted type 2 ATP-grasp protein [Leptolyngbyaceae cyanobacterium SL_1_1]|nr:circularly permuted type 2 ATP-grasp protein [Leptolyngbyaceae cyanobacterium RM1_1_2]NJO08510.1 circularly permuted type 2 ATP-grasp protein [Leptolyngbyaceae cyanobacterium SL_1_1]
MTVSFNQPQAIYNEYFTSSGQPRPEIARLADWIDRLTFGQLEQTEAAAEAALRELSATFVVEGEERVLPFDILPRVISAQTWQTLEKGLKQRVAALNHFCGDVYGPQQIMQDGKVPRLIVESAAHFLPACRGMQPPGGVWCHVSGTDLVRDADGQWYVLEDNLRVPSGIAYVLKNRQVMERIVPQLVEQFDPEPIDHYSQQLQRTLAAASLSKNPAIALLTPGPHESAYFEHALLAEQMGAALVEAQDLAIADDYLHYSSDRGLSKIDVLYRRGDTPLFNQFQPTGYSSGVAAMIDLCQRGRLGIANAIGAGVADDKVIYAYVPEMIRYYLSEDSILPNVPTYLCWRERDRQYVLEHLDELVVKAASEEGGHGMLIGPHASQSEREDFAAKIQARPRNYMAQPTLCLSQIPIVVDGKLEGRHVDLRPYILHQGDDIHVHPGGLTRVALEKGSLVVNSSQGGGSKDTWVLKR